MNNRKVVIDYFKVPNNKVYGFQDMVFQYMANNIRLLPINVKKMARWKIYFKAYFIFMTIFKYIVNFSEYFGLRNTVTRFWSWRLIVKKFVMIFINRKANKVNLIFGYVWSLPKLYEKDALTLTDRRKKWFFKFRKKSFFNYILDLFINVHEDTHIKNNTQLYPVVEIF